MPFVYVNVRQQVYAEDLILHQWSNIMYVHHKSYNTGNYEY